MTKRMDRRDFVRGIVVSAVAVGAAGSLRAALAGAATIAGSGPYGSLGTADANGILLPAGFTSRLLATSGDVVAGSTTVWHDAPDGGTCFASPGGGWVYVSNSEVALAGGGASALRFDGSGTIVGAHRILSGTTRNCAGGRTVAGTWLSCEENGDVGRVWECNPQLAGQGVVRAVADMSQQSSVVVTWQSASGPAVAGPFSIQAALRQGQVEFGDEPSAKGAWPARGGEVFSRLLSTAGYSPVPEELEELLSATYGVLLGPKGTLMPGQTRALRVVSVTFDR